MNKDELYKQFPELKKQDDKLFEELARWEQERKKKVRPWYIV